MDSGGGELMVARTSVIHVAVAVLVLCAPPAFAQSGHKPSRVTVAVSGGVQQAADEISDQFTFPKNIETETVDVKYPKKPTGLFDIGAAVRFWNNVGIGVAVSYVTGNRDADVSASVPHPFFFNQPRAISGTENGITHSETGIHVQLQYLVPSSGRLRVVLEGGPSWLNVEHEVVTDVTVTESYPYDTAAFGGAVTKSSTASAAGFNAGVDATWMFSPTIGLGGLVRYTRADVDLHAQEGRTLSMKAGGVQAGVGVRFVF